MRSETSRQHSENRLLVAREPSEGGIDPQDDPGRADWGEPLARALAVAPIAAPGMDAVADVQRGVSSNATFYTSPLAHMERVLRRIAWGGDKTRGVARLEFGEGVLSGGTLLIEASSGGLSMVLELPPDASLDAWAERLAQRLRARGLRIDEFLVQ